MLLHKLEVYATSQHKLKVYATKTSQTKSLCYQDITNWKFMVLSAQTFAKNFTYPKVFPAYQGIVDYL